MRSPRGFQEAKVTTNGQVVSALGWSRANHHSWNWTQRPISCQVPSVQMGVSKLWRERVEAHLEEEPKTEQSNVRKTFQYEFVVTFYLSCHL